MRKVSDDLRPEALKGKSSTGDRIFEYITPQPSDRIWKYYLAWMAAIIMLYLFQKFMFDGSLEYGIVQPLRTILFIGSPTVLLGLYSLRKLRFFTEENFKLARQDVLTGLWNRRALQEHIDRKFSGSSGAIILMDIDKFKSINDRYGHAAGDLCLRQVAEFVQSTLPAGGLVGRWGGDEFLAILDRFDLDTYRGFSDKLVSGAKLEGRMREDLPRVTISSGFARFDEVESVDSLLSLSDRRLYSSKAKRQTLS